MICLMASQSHLGMAVIFFYTCFWIPFHQMKKFLGRLFFGVIFFAHFQQQEEEECMSLPVARFQDLQAHGTKRCGQVLEKTCSVCLVDFEEEDLVSQLGKCGHVFHVDCIERWIESSHFTCPVCRSLFFNVKTCHAKLDEEVNISSSYINGGFSWYY
ncbi:hypothetical protein C1H46_000461 [Malus baccata]|uniref:RING-type domain-containing protein n=1 Tax=Malus baccata TaxID=106549 RepID=A0A540NTD9_MALBA|nr:hypothetical protein C1H46_000461 [Malus baccata]